MTTKKGSDKEIRKIVNLLKKQGFIVNDRANGHYEVRTATNDYVTDLAGSPSEYRGWKNMLADLRNAGFIDPYKPHKKKDQRP